MNLFPEPSYKVAFFVTLAVAVAGAISLYVETEYPEGGWFALILGTFGAVLTLYKGATRRPGR